MLTLTRIDWCK